MLGGGGGAGAGGLDQTLSSYGSNDMPMALRWPEEPPSLRWVRRHNWEDSSGENGLTRLEERFGDAASDDF